MEGTFSQSSEKLDKKIKNGFFHTPLELEFVLKIAIESLKETVTTSLNLK